VVLPAKGRYDGKQSIATETAEETSQRSRQRVLIIGCNGFIGRHLALELRGDWCIRGTYRSEEGIKKLPSCVEGFQLDVTTTVGWAEALDGVDAVIHLAARTHILRDGSAGVLGRYAKVNVGGTQRALEMCQLYGIKRLVYVSSIKAVGEGSSLAYSENTACRPEDAYGITKRQAEELILGRTREDGMETLILRPPLVYGPGVRGNFQRLLRAADISLPLPLAGIRNARSMLFVGNLTHCIRFLLQSPCWPSAVYHVADAGAPLSTPGLLQEISTLMGRKSHLFQFPETLLRWGLALVGRREDARRLTRSLIVDASKLKTELGWNPPIPHAEGLRETVTWYLNSKGV